jgi:hypothetical protein
MSYTQAITELRQILADTEFHKKATKKKIIGKIDGNNQTFVTYDKRLLEDTVEVFVNDEAVNFTLEDSVKGLLTLNEAPVGNVKVTSSYYFTWWIDDEIKNFLNKGAEITSQWTSTVPDDAYLSIQPGLKTAALFVAASISTRSLIQYLVNRRHSEEFNIEQDGNDDSGFSQMISALQKTADSYWKDGHQMRDDFYKRQGKRSAPAFGIKIPRTRQYGPNR